MDANISTGPYRIIVTGDREDLSTRCPSEVDGRRLEWIQLPVLRFERIPIDEGLVERLIHKPVDWILFTSARAVQFWSEVLMQNGVDFPTETQVACIGEQTATVAASDGFTPDFYPTEPGTENFLEEFESLIENNSIKPSVFIPMAEGGRFTIRDRLKEWGCDVISVPLYRTVARDDINRLIKREDVESASLILFTSPSSFDAFTKVFKIPQHAKVVSLGRYTANHLIHRGVSDQQVLPEGDFQRISEVM